MPQAPGPQAPLNQQAPVIAPDLSTNSGLIDQTPFQAPLPPVNIPGRDGTGADGRSTVGTMSISDMFNSMKSPEDEKQYNSPVSTPQQLTKRYSTWNPNIDNEEVAASKQSSFSRLANGVIKGLGTAVGTFAESLMTIPDTVKALQSGNFSDMYQSDLEKSTDTWMDNLEDQFPNYYSKWEKDHPFLSVLPFSGGAANFWSDKVVKNLGFTLGAIGGAAFQDTAVGALTEGIGDIPLVGSQIGKAALWMNKMFSSETKLGELLGAAKPGLMSTLRGAATEAGASENAFLNMDQLARAAATTKITNAGRYALNLYGASRTEDGFMARMGYNKVKADLTDQFKLQNNRDPSIEEASDIEKYATSSANVRFGAQFALTTLSNAIQFDGILKPMSSARKGISSSLETALAEPKIGIKAGTVDTFEKVVPATISGKIWDVVKPVIPNILAEGVFAMGGQYAAQVGTENYYERKYYADKGIPIGSPDKTPWDPSSIVNAMHSSVKALAEEFGSTEGMEMMMLGAVTGVVTHGFRHFYDKIKGEGDKSTQATISMLNDNSVTGLLENMFGNTTKSAFHAQEMQDAVKSNDLFKYKNNQSDLFTNYVLSHLQANRFDVGVEKLNLAKDLPQAEFEKAFGIENSTGNKKTVGDYIEKLKEKAEAIKNNYDAINEVFKNPYHFDPKAKDKDGVLENDKHNKFEEWKYTLLQHTSNIEDSNRRLGDIGQKVARANPAVTRELVQNLTHPVQLAAMATRFEGEAADIKKSFDDKLILPEERKEQMKQMKTLQDHATSIRSFLDTKAGIPPEDYLKLFDGLLHFSINGEDANAKQPIEVRKQVLPGLIRDGVDANKLEARKVVAGKAYDILTSEKGFNKYFSLLQDKEDRSAELAQYHPAQPLDVGDNKFEIPIKTADGKETTFKEGSQYTVNTGDKDNINAQQVTYQGIDDSGNLKFTTQDNQLITLPPEKISLLGDLQKEIGTNFTKTLAGIGGGSPVVSDVVPHEEDKKKDITRGPRSTTDPRYKDTSDFDNFHRRHQSFLFNLGSTDPEEFNQAVKSRLRILPVTAGTAEILGFPKEFTEQKEGEEPTIRAVYVAFDENQKPYLLDQKGHKVQDLDGSPINPSQIIFSTLPDTSLQYQGGERYTNKANLDPTKVAEWQKKFRDELLSKEAGQMPQFAFQVSRGIPNIINVEARNSVTSVGLVNESDLNHIVITIPTQGDVAIAAILADQGEGIAADASAVNMPLGIPLLNHGGNLIFLNNRKLTTHEASNSYDLIAELAKRVGENKLKGENPLDQTILKYLSRILYFSSPVEGKEVSPNQMWIDNEGMHFGTSFTVPFFTNTVEANKDRITAFLQDSYHNVNNAELGRVNRERAEDLRFNTISVKGSKLISTKEYPSYQHYLLDSDNPPLTTNIAKPQNGEPPVTQKYSVLQVKSFDNKALSSDEKKVVAPTPAVKGSVKKPGGGKAVPKKEAANRPPQKRHFWSRHAEDKNDPKGLTSGNGTTPLTAKGIEEAEKLGEEMVDKGVTNIIAPPVTRSIQTAEIISKITGASVDTTSSLANRLKSWDIGEWANTSDEDFARAEKFFVANPTVKEFEGKSLNEDFQSYIGRIVTAGNEIEAKSPDGTMIITHSKNLNIWDAYNKSGKAWDEKAKAEYLQDKAPDNAKLTEGSQNLESNELEMVHPLGNGRSVRYAQVFDEEGNLSDVRIIAGISKDGSEVPADKMNSTSRDLFKHDISEALGLIAPTPSITVAPKAEEIKEAVKEVNKPSIPEKPAPPPSSAAAKLMGHKAKPTDTQYRAANVIPGDYRRADIEQEFEKAKAMLPDYVQFVMTKNLIKMTGGGKAWGAMKDAAIYVYKNAEVGTTYHEAFEMVWQNFLEGKNQLALYNEFKERDGKFTSFEGKEVEYGQANFKEAKEQIAEEFRDYVLNKDTNLPTKQKNWFQRVVDFIKNIFLGSQDDINQLFKNITEGYYKNYPASQKDINSIEYRNIKASEAFIQDTLQGMTADLFSREFEKDSAIVTQLEENPKQAVATIYGRLFNSMQHFFTSDDPNATDTLQAIYSDKIAGAKDEGSQANIVQDFEGLQKHWEFIKNNWDAFATEHMQYLKVFKVKFSVDDEGEVSMNPTQRRELEDYEKMTGQSEYANDSLTMNARNSSSEVVKLTFATIADREFQKDIIGKSIEAVRAAQGDDKTRIKRENSQVRMAKLAPYAKFFNYVLHNVTNINGIYDIYKKLVDMSNNTRIKSNALVDALANRLDFKSGFKGKSLDQMKGLLSMELALSKQKPKFVSQFVDDQGKVYFQTSIVNSRVDQTIDNWITAIKGSSAVKVTSDSNFIFNKSVKDIKDPVDFLHTIGIEMDKEDYVHLSASDKTEFNSEVNGLRSVFEENVGKKLPIFTTKQLGIDNRLIKLASLYVDKIVGDDTDSMHFNMDGELTGNFVLNNYSSTILNDANNSKTKGEFIAKNPQFNDIFHQDSILLNEKLFDKDNKFISPIEIAVIEGRRSAVGDNRSSYSLTEAERYVQEINHNLEGVFYTLLPADAKTEWGIYSGQYIKASEYFDEVTHENAVAKFTDRMYSNLQTEINLARDYATNPNRQNITELGKVVDGRTKGASLRFFKDILPRDRVEEINKRVIDGEERIEDVLHKEGFAAIMRDWAQDKAEKSFKYLSDNKIFGVSNRDNFKLNGLLSDFVTKNLGPRKNYYSKEEATNLLAFREMNYAINNIEMHKFFFGDPAQYSDEMKRIKSFLSGRDVSHVDTIGTAEGFNQAANGLLNQVGKATLKPGDPGYHVFKNEMNALTVHDIMAESTSLPMLEETLGKKEAKPYTHMNEADASTWQMATSYRETLLKSGGMRWSQKMENQHQWEMAWERQAKEKEGTYKYSSDELNREDIRLMKKPADPDVKFYITKPVHSGIQTKENTAIVSLDKTSGAPLYYRFAKEMGAQLADLYNVMQEKGTDYIRVESAHKVGIQNDSNIPLYKEDGSINKEGILKATHEAIPYKYYGIQVDQSGKHEGQTEGTQLRHQAVGDLMNAGVPIDYKGEKEWSTLTNEEKEKSSPIHNLVREHEDDLTALSNKRYQNLVSKLGVTINEDGTNTYKDVKKVSDFILKEVTRRELPNNLRDAIEPDPDDPSKFKIPLEALSNYQQVRAILWSTIGKNIVRPKVSGGMKTQLAATGWEKEHRVVKGEVNGRAVYTSSELKFYVKGEDGKTAKCEVYLPFHFGRKIREGLEKKGHEFKTDKEFRDHILNYLNSTPEGKQLLKGIGFRIPTQRDNSIESFVIKDFLPEQMGDTIVFPSEITAKAGSDFDIDKMNTYLRNFFTNKQGYPEVVPFERVDSNSQEDLKDYYEKYMLEARRSYDQWNRERSGKNLVNKLFDTEDEEREPDYVPTLEEYLLQSQGKSAYEINSQEAIENKYFDTLEKIYALPEKFKGLVSPNDASDMKDIAKEISKLKDPNWSDTKEPYGRALDSLWMMQERHKYLTGKKGVGIAAVSQTNLNINQGARVYINLPKGVQIRLKSNVLELNGAEYPSLSAILNVKGENISKVNASFIDGYVDISKGAWIIDMGANDSNAGVFLLLNKLGADPYQVALLMNQPAIQEYINQRETRKSVSQINKEVETKNGRELYQEVNKIFPTNGGIKVLDRSKPKFYETKQMEDMIRNHGRGEKLSKEENTLQMQMLSDYQGYYKLGWSMFDFYQGYNWDTSRSNDPNLVRRHLIAQQKAEGGPISSISRVMEDSTIGAIRENTIKVDGALRALMSTESGRSSDILDATAKDLSERKGVTEDEYRKAMLKATSSILDYTIQTTPIEAIGGRTLNQLTQSLLLGDNPTARYLKAMQDSGDPTLTSNPIIKNLRANLDYRPGKPSNIELIEKDNDPYTSNIWTGAFRELAGNQTVISIDDNPKNDLSVAQIYQRMVLTSMLQSGSKRSSISFSHLIPNEHYNAIIGDAVRDMKGDLDNFYDNNVLYRTNWSDDTLVPIAPPITQDHYVNGQLTSRKVYPTFNSDSFNQHLKDQGVQNIPKILQLNEFTWKDKKAVKTVEWDRDPETKQIINKTVRLFQRIDTSTIGGEDTHLVVSNKEILPGDTYATTFKYAVFKEINKWGDGNKVQEYYDNKVNSLLDTNPLVNEVPDDLIIYGIMNSGYTVSSDNYLGGDLADKYKNPTVAQGASNVDTEQEGEEEQNTPPISTNKTPINFKQIEIEDIKRATKKDFFRISDTSEVGEAEGYKVNIKSHPDLDLYVRKSADKYWSISDNKTGRELAVGNTAKEAIQNGVERINRVIKSGGNDEGLNKLGVAKEVDDVLKDKDNGCKEG